MSGDVKALINHYAREGFYRHIQTVCDEVIKKRGNEPTLLFWKAFGVAMEVRLRVLPRRFSPCRHLVGFPRLFPPYSHDLICDCRAVSLV